MGSSSHLFVTMKRTASPARTVCSRVSSAGSDRRGARGSASAKPKRGDPAAGGAARRKMGGIERYDPRAGRASSAQRTRSSPPRGRPRTSGSRTGSHQQPLQRSRSRSPAPAQDEHEAEEDDGDSDGSLTSACSRRTVASDATTAESATLTN